MAWLEQEPNGVYHVAFRFQGRRYKRSLATKSKKRATTRAGRLEENLELVNAGRLEVPADADLATFLLSDGKVNTLGFSRQQNLSHDDQEGNRHAAVYLELGQTCRPSRPRTAPSRTPISD